MAQLPLQRGLRDIIWGKDGLFGGATVVSYATDESGMLHPLSEEDAQTARAHHNAEEDRIHESMALRVDQYELNLQWMRQICQQRGDLQEVAYLIQEGMPPTIRQPISPS